MIAEIPLTRFSHDEGIPGWFDWEAYTDRVVEEAPAGAVFVELGVFFGRSVSYLAKAARRTGKPFTVVGIDNFLGSPEFEGRVWIDDLPPSQWRPGTLIGDAFASLQNDGVGGDVTLIVGDSAKSAALFADRSVWSVFVDAGHDEASVRADIAAWVPKVMPGGWLAGHDYWSFPEVRSVVDAMLPNVVVSPSRNWWEVRL